MSLEKTKNLLIDILRFRSHNALADIGLQLYLSKSSLSMPKHLFGFLLFLSLVSTLGCSDGKPSVIVDDRSEEVKQQELDDYDKQMAEDAKSQMIRSRFSLSTYTFIIFDFPWR